MYGLYSRAASNQERPMMARVRYSEFSYLKDMDMYLSSSILILIHLQILFYNLYCMQTEVNNVLKTKKHEEMIKN